MTLQLFAVTEGGPRELAVETSGGTVHDVLERLPGGVYSALRTFEHVRFLWLEEHLARTARSMRGLGWPKTLDEARLRPALHACVSGYPAGDARVRFDVLRDPVEVQGVSADMFVALSPLVPVPAKFMEEGVRVEFAPQLHRDQPRIKTTEFVRRRKPFPLGLQERYEHVMLDDDGRILECSSANIAFVRGDELVCAGDGVLEGITLAVLFHLAPELGLRVVRERLAVADLARVDEAFLSSSVRGVVPIVQVAEQRIGSGRVGPRVRALDAAYHAFAGREARPAV